MVPLFCTSRVPPAAPIIPCIFFWTSGGRFFICSWARCISGLLASWASRVFICSMSWRVMTKYSFLRPSMTVNCPVACSTMASWPSGWTMRARSLER